MNKVRVHATVRRREGRAKGNVLDSLDQKIEVLVQRLDAGFQNRDCILLLTAESGGDAVVPRQFKIDDPVGARRRFVLVCRRHRVDIFMLSH